MRRFEFSAFSSGTVRFDLDTCSRCETKACVAACNAPNLACVLELRDGLPALRVTPEAAARGGCIECLAAYIGTTWRTLLELFEADRETDAVVAYGEIGSANEEEAAEAMRAGLFRKPLVVLVAGKNACHGMRFGHAGAIVSAHSGSAAGKIAALKGAGATVLDHLDEIGPAVARVLGKERMRA